MPELSHWKSSASSLFYLTPSLARLMSAGRISKTIQESVLVPEAVSSNNGPGKEIVDRKISEIRLISQVRVRYTLKWRYEATMSLGVGDLEHSIQPKPP